MGRFFEISFGMWDWSCGLVGPNTPTLSKQMVIKIDIFLKEIQCDSALNGFVDLSGQKDFFAKSFIGRLLLVSRKSHISGHITLEDYLI